MRIAVEVTVSEVRHLNTIHRTKKGHTSPSAYSLSRSNCMLKMLAPLLVDLVWLANQLRSAAQSNMIILTAII